MYVRFVYIALACLEQSQLHDMKHIIHNYALCIQQWWTGSSMYAREYHNDVSMRIEAHVYMFCTPTGTPISLSKTVL